MNINVAKTKCMVFQTRFSKVDVSNFHIHVESETVELVSCFKYLGVWLTNHVQFDKHFDEVCKKMANRTFLLSRYRRNFTAKWKHILATSLISSVLGYCLPIWGVVPETKMNRINSILLRAAKLVVKPKSYGKMSKIDKIEQLNWLVFQEMLFFPHIRI